MNIIAVDDERIMLDGLVLRIQEAAQQEDIRGFRYSKEALEYAIENKVDVAFLDINMPGMTGLELGKELLAINPDTNLIFCTAYDEYISEAFRNIRCNGYIMKPVDTEQIRQELDHLRIPLKKKETSRIRVQCFDRFEIYVDGSPMEFEHSKTKELMAYLINNCGSMSSNQEIISILWDDDYNHDSYLKKLRKDLQDTLDRYGCEDVIWRQRGGMGINPEKIDCDYYNWKKDHKEKYEGDYMRQYDWANVPEYEW